MASLLRQIVAGPRARHPEAGLDLCYVTDNIIATSGPSGTYPQRAYRNPLDRLVAFLDAKHGTDWAIWEFRAEGTGYPDEEVYNRIRHYPWPDHHPPPFRLIPLITASMRNWLHGGDLEGGRPQEGGDSQPVSSDNVRDGQGRPVGLTDAERQEKKTKRVVVVHCKAGKGRSGTASCSYLIAEEGWSMEDALERFTKRRMRPSFGQGVSIPSQLRWIGYVDRWTKGGKLYRDVPVEIVEIHIWGLRNGVKVQVAGFVRDGKQIKVFHTFKREERVVVEGNPPESGIVDAMWEMAGYDSEQQGSEGKDTAARKSHTEPVDAKRHPGSLKQRGSRLVEKASPPGSHHKIDKLKAKTLGDGQDSPASSSEKEPGGMAVIMRPQSPIGIPSCDVNISVERRNKTAKAIGRTFVSAVAHVWFNTYFESNAPESGGQADDNGVFEIDWNAMDGIKGSSRKGTRAFDRLAVVWRTAPDKQGAVVDTETVGKNITEPAEGERIPEPQPADWHGDVAAGKEKDLGPRNPSPEGESVSKASSIHTSSEFADGGGPGGQAEAAPGMKESLGIGSGGDGDDLEGVKSGGPDGRELTEEEPRRG